MLTVVFLFLLLKESKQKEPIFEKAEELYTFNINESVLLPCSVTNQFSDYKRKVLFHWMKHKPDGSVVWNWPRYRIKPNKGLKIRQLQKHDEGVYFCNAESKVGGFKSIKRVLIVGGNASKEFHQEIETPTVGFVPLSSIKNLLQVTSSLIKKKFKAGSHAKLKCAVKGNPSPTIQWFINGTKIDSSEQYFTHRSSLTVYNLTQYNNGNYTCFATNKHGMVHMNINVEVTLPKVYKFTSSVVDTIYVKSGENVTLECSVPENEVSYLLWHSSKKKEDLFGSRQNDIRRLIHHQTEVRNNTRFEKIWLVNVTHGVDEGIYKCLALFKESQTPTEIKVVHVVIPLYGKADVKQVDTSWINSNLKIYLLVILPIGCLILLVILIYTCRRYRLNKETECINDGFIKSSDASLGQLLPCVKESTPKNLDKSVLASLYCPTSCPTDSIKIHYDKIDRSSQLCLTQYPTGSIRVHNNKTDFISHPTAYTNHDKNDLLIDKIKYPNTCKVVFEPPKISSSVSVKNSYDLASQNSRSHISRYSEKSDSDIALNLPIFVGDIFNLSSSPRNLCKNKDNKFSNCSFLKYPLEEHFPGDSNFLGFEEKPVGIYKQCSKEPKNNKSKNVSLTDGSTSGIFSAVPTEENISNMDLQIIHKKNDCLLDREIRNWEILIKNRTPYVSDIS